MLFPLEYIDQRLVHRALLAARIGNAKYRKISGTINQASSEKHNFTNLAK